MQNSNSKPQEEPQHIARRHATLAQAREAAQDLAEMHEITFYVIFDDDRTPSKPYQVIDDFELGTFYASWRADEILFASD